MQGDAALAILNPRGMLRWPRYADGYAASAFFVLSNGQRSTAVRCHMPRSKPGERPVPRKCFRYVDDGIVSQGIRVAAADDGHSGVDQPLELQGVRVNGLRLDTAVSASGRSS